ncbi:MAG: lysine--tRNA ligase, partial [Halodesulfurarchaeum sp.]
EVLEFLEAPVVRYFFSKDPRKARDFSIEHADQLVEEFDRLEAIYFDEVEASEEERARAERVYPFLVEEVRPDRVRIPFTFAAVLGMTEDPELREEIARREGHVPEDAPEWAVEQALDRVERAREWARRTDNAFNYELKRESMPDVEIDEQTAAALDSLAAFIEDGATPEEIQGEIYETARRHDLDVGDFFATGYRLFFDQSEGPKLGTFLGKLDEEFVLARLRRER